MNEQERRSNEKYNYYFALALDFRKPELSKSVIQSAFEKKRTEWSANKNNPAKRRDIEQYIELTGKSGSFERIMLADDVASPERIEEAEAARNLADQKIDRIINNFCGVKKISTAEVKKLLERNKKYQITLEEFRNKLKKYGIQEIDEKLDNGAKSTAYAQIKKDLDVIGKKTLYEYLFTFVNDPKNGIANPNGGTKWSQEDIYLLTGEQLGRISDAAFQKFNAVATKTEKVNANKSLAGACRNCLVDPIKRKEYDGYISSTLPEEVAERIDSFGINGQISLEQSKDLIKLYSQLQPKLSVEEIIQILKEEFISRKIYNYEMPNHSRSNPTFKRCNICGALTEPQHSHCSSCGATFEVKCFKCGAMVDNGINNCPHCGTDLKSKVLVENECAMARKCLDRHDFEGAANCIARAKRIWSDSPMIAPLEQEVATKRKQLESSISHINSLVQKRHFIEAGNELNKLQARVPGYRDDVLAKRIQAGITEGNEWLKKAKGSLNNESMMIDYCTKALASCADLQDARLLMLKYPPLPASDIRVVQRENSNVISWQPSKSSGAVVYRLLKKEGSLPANDTDGELLIETSACQYVDNKLKANVATYYTIYTYRAGISTVPVSNNAAVYNYVDVSEFKLAEANGTINLSWSLDSGISDIEIYRKANSPITAYGDGEKLLGIVGDTYSDLNLTNDIKYYYAIFAMYKTARGISHSKGKMIAGIPTSPPDTVQKCVLEKDGYVYSLRWNPVQKGNVEVLVSDKQLDWKPGEMFSAEEIYRNLKNLPITSRRSSGIQFELKTEGVHYLYPVNFVSQTGVVGECVRISSVADFTELNEIRLSGDTIYISFNWSCKADYATIAYKTDGYPTGPADAYAKKVVVSREQFAKEKYVSIYDIERNNYYFAIYATYGKDTYSSGLFARYCNAARQNINYSVKLEKSLFGKIKGYKLQVSSDNDSGLPKMVLYKKNGVQPLNKGDGILAYVVEAQSGSTLDLSIPDTAITEKTKFQLFFEQDNLYDRIQLLRR